MAEAASECRAEGQEWIEGDGIHPSWFHTPVMTAPCTPLHHQNEESNQCSELKRQALYGFIHTRTN
jgi:hypothetical protein